MLRAVILAVMFVVACRLMHDIGFTPERGGRPLAEMRRIASESIEYGWRVPAVKWLMLPALFTGGVGIYGFYALQPYLLELYGDPEAYGIAGLSAAIVAGAQILGGLAAPRIRMLFQRRTSALILIAALSSLTLVAVGTLRGVLGRDRAGVDLGAPVRGRHADPAGLHQRDDPLEAACDDSFVRLAVRSSGGVWAQPALGRAADVWGYAPTYLISAGISALALPFLALSRRQHADADLRANN